jgi:hypothetical protein
MDKKETRRYRGILPVILLLSFLLRVVLILSGGQYAFPDEDRYEKSRVAAAALWSGNLYDFLHALHSADHFLFKVIGVVPATMQLLLAPSPKIPALFFSLFSMACLWLLWGIMRRTGENERVALFAVSLLALCSTFLYYCRHLLPYDTAMAFGLFALFAGLRTPSRDVDSVWCGLFSLCAFLTYNGYWVLAGFAMLTHVLRPPLTPAQGLRRALASGLSFAVPLAAILATSAAIASADGNLLQQFLAFSRTVTQGSYAEGWSLPFCFLWHSEHFLILLWAAALIYSLRECALGRRKEALILGLLGVLFIYGTLVIFSVVLEKFVVYGRLVRQLVPFCCMLAALFLERLWTSSPKAKSLAMVVLAAAVFQAAVNFRQPFTQMFPVEFRRLAAEASVPTKAGQYEVLFDCYIYPEPLPVKAAGRVIIQKRHPLQFLPYQYEGHTPEQRSKLRSNDISMRLILKENADKPVAPGK